MQLVRMPIEDIVIPEGTAGALLFGGDRLLACDEAIVALEGNDQVGLVTISPTGEDGQGPAIVGLWVEKNHRRRGLGLSLLEAALERSKERGWAKVRLDLISSAALAVARKVRPELADLMDIGSVDMFGMFPGDFLDL